MTNRWTRSAVLAVLLTIPAGAAHADEAADRCGSSKMKAVGKYAQTVLKCHSTATKRNEATDPECLTKASGKLTSAFDKAEGVGGCVTTNDEGTASTALDDDVDAIL